MLITMRKWWRDGLCSITDVLQVSVPDLCLGDER